MSDKQNEPQFYRLQKVRCIIFANSTYAARNRDLAEMMKTDKNVKLIKELSGVEVDAQNLMAFFDFFDRHSGVKYDVELYPNLNKSQTLVKLKEGKRETKMHLLSYNLTLILLSTN